MCTYCGCESIEVIGRFMAEHTDIINAAGVLRRACEEGDPSQVLAAVQEVEKLLHPHTRNEEDGLFTVMRRQEEFVDHIDSLCEEHTTLDDQLEAIKQGDHALVDTFIHDLRHHIEREDNGLFPASAIALEGPDWAEVESLTAPPPS